MITVVWEETDQLPVTPAKDALWLHPALVSAYPDGRYLAAKRGSRLVGLWHVPLEIEDEALHARRSVRLLPYAAPWLENSHPSKRREVMLALLRALQANVASVDLPLAPGFEDSNACREVGVLVEQRHTHVVDLLVDYKSAYSPTVRNHLATAHQVTTLDVSQGASDFDFSRGVVGQTSVAVVQRAQFAERLEKVAAVRCLSLRHDSQIVGQGLVVVNDSTGYYFHSWFDRKGPRGVPSRLLDEAMKLSRTQLGAKLFDFEGSVVPSVDRFMTGFGAKRSAYGYLLWHRDPSRMATLAIRDISQVPSGSEAVRATAWSQP